MQRSSFLYLLIVLIWGSTWLAIKYQLGNVAPELSVGYRFILAAMILFAIMATQRKLRRLSWKTHRWLLLQGLTLFSMNYVFFYFAELTVTSAICSIVFSTIVGLNILNGALCFGNPIRRNVVIGALIGFIGIVLVFMDELLKFQLSRSTLAGLLMSLLSTVIASFGNMTAIRNQKNGIYIMETNAYGMLYGALIMFLMATVRQVPLTFDGSIQYVGSLLYLSIFGSVIAFGAYLTLLKRIGADRASYAAVLFPIVALALSTFFEGYRWTWLAILGVLLTLVGNVIVLTRKDLTN